MYTYILMQKLTEEKKKNTDIIKISKKGIETKHYYVSV